jgi:Uma2 family endonuclease
MAEISLDNRSYEEYLSLEEDPQKKFEYHDGYIRAMAGGSPEHGQVAGNFIRFAGNALMQTKNKCRLLTSDVKVHIESRRRTFYPDASIVCGSIEKSERDPLAITNPILILEVLSPATEAFDRGAKFAHYRELPSLREYVLIQPEIIWVDVFHRNVHGFWEITSYNQLDQKVILKSLGCELAMEDIYYLMTPGKASDPSI